MKSKSSRFRENIYYLSGLLPNEVQKKIENRFNWYNRKKAAYRSSLFELIGGFCGAGLLFVLGRFSDSEINPVFYGSLFGFCLASLEGSARTFLNSELKHREKVRYINRHDKIEVDTNESVAFRDDGYYLVDVYDNNLKIGNVILDANKDSYYNLYVSEDYDEIGKRRLKQILTHLYREQNLGSLFFGVPYHCFNGAYKGIKNMIGRRKISFNNLEKLIKKESIGKH